MPHIGAIPANLSRYRGRLRMSFFPIEDGTHTKICSLFPYLAASSTGTQIAVLAEADIDANAAKEQFVRDV